MREDLIKLLSADKHNAELGSLLQKCKDYVESSRNEISKYYPAWDFANDVYRGRRSPDEQDKKAAKRKEPQKMILPMTKSQVETFVAFFVRVLTQRPDFWELIPTSDEDVVPARMGQAVLQRDLQHNNFKDGALTQFGRNIAKYGVGVLKETWVRNTKMVKDLQPDPTFVPNPTLPNVEPPMVETVTEEVEYLGNKVVSVSPYQFFPDPGVPLTRVQEGDFVAFEEEQPFSYLEDLQRDGTTAGVEHVRRTISTDSARRLNFAEKAAAGSVSKEKNARFGVLTEVIVNLNPARTEIAPGVMLDKTIDQMIKCLVWYVNDDRIVRIEPDMGYEHNQFPVSCSQWINDGEEFVNGGLAEDIGALQETATWFINAHVTSVRKVIDNKIVVDPKFIEMKDLEERRSVIRTKPGASQTGMEKWFMQLQVQDVTANHIKDVDWLSGAAKEGTGINENLLGQFSNGRRSAAEARNVNSNSAARILLTVSGAWGFALVPLGRRMLSNLRQGLDVEQLVRVYGESRTQADAQASMAHDPAGLNAVARFLPVSKKDLVGRYDFEHFDGTLPSQRGATAMQLREVLDGLIKNPTMIVMSGYDPALILTEILELLDVRNTQRLRLTPERLQQYMQMAGAGGNQAGPSGGPQQGQAANGPGAGSGTKR